MRRFQTLTAWFAAAALCALVFYGIPTLLEMLVLPRTGMVFEVIIGDLFGCLLLALSNWKKAFSLYLVLRAVEYFSLSAHIARPAQIVWFSDFVPAVVLSVWLINGARTFATAASIEDDFRR